MPRFHRYIQPGITQPECCCMQRGFRSFSLRYAMHQRRGFADRTVAVIAIIGVLIGLLLGGGEGAEAANR